MFPAAPWDAISNNFLGGNLFLLRVFGSLQVGFEETIVRNPLSGQHDWNPASTQFVHG